MHGTILQGTLTTTLAFSTPTPASSTIRPCLFHTHTCLFYHPLPLSYDANGNGHIERLELARMFNDLRLDRLDIPAELTQVHARASAIFHRLLRSHLCARSPQAHPCVPYSSTLISECSLHTHAPC